MNNKLFVGKIAPTTLEVELEEKFSEAGTVLSCELMIDRITGRSRGFAFIEMENEQEAQNAIRMFDGHEYEKRRWSVSIARPKR